jgi:predicted dehydrogenase
MNLSRRKFIKKVTNTVFTLNLPLYIPVSVLGRSGNVATNDRINVGFIGMGDRVLGDQRNNYTGLLKFFMNEETCMVRAVCDVNALQLDIAKDRVNQFYNNKSCLTFRDFREMLIRSDIDAIVIGTSHNWHGVMTVLGCEHGKDVYVEKPISNTIIEAQKMAQAADRYGRIVQAGTQARSSTRFHYVVNVIQQGILGKIKKISIGCDNPPIHCDLSAQPVPEYLDWDMWVGPSPWRPYHQELYNQGGKYIGFGGGGITDWGQHFFDVAQWALEMDDSGPTEIYPPDGKDYEFLTYKYDNGTEMFLHMKNNQRLSSGTLFFGEFGEIDTLAWEDKISFKPEYLAHQYFDQAYRGTNVDPRLMGNHVYNFLNCIRTRRKPNADINLSYRSITVAHLTNIALHLRRPLRWDPVAVRFVGDQEANRYLETVHRLPWVI